MDTENLKGWGKLTLKLHREPNIVIKGHPAEWKSIGLSQNQYKAFRQRHLSELRNIFTPAELQNVWRNIKILLIYLSETRTIFMNLEGFLTLIFLGDNKLVDNQFTEFTFQRLLNLIHMFFKLFIELRSGFPREIMFNENLNTGTEWFALEKLLTRLYNQVDLVYNYLYNLQQPLKEAISLLNLSEIVVIQGTDVGINLLKNILERVETLISSYLQIRMFIRPTIEKNLIKINKEIIIHFLKAQSVFCVYCKKQLCDDRLSLVLSDCGCWYHFKCFQFYEKCYGCESHIYHTRTDIISLKKTSDNKMNTTIADAIKTLKKHF